VRRSSTCQPGVFPGWALAHAPDALVAIAEDDAPGSALVVVEALADPVRREPVQGHRTEPKALLGQADLR
jgi:hypothetical protein